MSCYTREQIEAAMASKGYKYFTGGDYDVNIIGVRNSETKGRVTNAFNTTTKLSSIEIAAAGSSGNSEAFAHVTDQRIYVSTSAPADNTIGNNGDIWYQTIT